MAKPTPEQSALEKKFLQSLGSFINIFASIENMLRELLAHFAEVDERTALALFSGVRTQEAIGFIRRIHTARNEPMLPALDMALKQMAIICGFRNDLLHHRTDFTQTPPIATNRASVLSEDAVRETEIDADTILFAKTDLATIGLIFSVYLQGLEGRANLDWVTEKTWQHKPPLPPSKRRHSSGAQDRPKP